jgi:signal peptidase
MESTPFKISACGEFGLFEDILNSGLSLRVKVTGRSMAPFLQGGEILTIKKVPCPSLQRGDLIFFKNRNGFPILHRIITKRQDSDCMIAFQTKGDALMAFDEPVRDNEILGKVCKIEDGSKYINMETKIWGKINYLTAVINLLESRLYFALRAFNPKNAI